VGRLPGDRPATAGRCVRVASGAVAP
jgi:hypothetical protein